MDEPTSRPSGGWEALEITIEAPIVSLRNPLYSGVQVGLPCPPPATVGGLLAATAGGWDHVEPATRFAMAFHAAGGGTDLETYHPLDAAGVQRDPRPVDREFLADVRLTVWIDTDLAAWERRLRRPVWPLRLGRSQDLATARTRRVTLAPGAGRQGHAVLPAEATTTGRLLRLPTAISLARDRTLWGSYRYHPHGTETPVPADVPHGVTALGEAVVFLPPTHPRHASPTPPEP